MTISPTPRRRVFRLTVPASPEFVATARLFVYGVAAAAIGDEDVTDDLKLAVSELVTAIVTHHSGDDVTVTATLEDHRLVVEVTPWPGDMEREDFGPLDIVDALFPGTASADGAVRVPVDLGDR